MNLKLPLEVEVPDVVYVGEIELTCEQVNDYMAIYDRRDNGGSFPYISIDLAEGKITGYVDGLDVWETFSVDGDGLYEAVLDIAKELTEMMSEGYNKWKQSTKKSTSKPTSFSDMVKKQRDKNIQKTIYGTASFTSLYRGFDELGTAEQWWVITYLKDKLGMNGFEEFIDNVVAYAYDKYEGQ